MADFEIQPGIITHDPFFIAPKPHRDRQTFSYRGDEEWVNVRFQSPHPWLFVVPSEFMIGGENDDGTRHRDLAVYVQTDNPSFPRDKKSIDASIRVEVKTKKGVTVHQIPVYLRNIQPIKDFEGVFAIDFGTTSTTCAFIDHFDGTSTVQTVKFDDLGWKPRLDTVGSLIYFNDFANASNPDYEIGLPAAQMWASGEAPLTAFKYSVKRYVGTGAQTFVLTSRARNPNAKPVFCSYEQLAQLVVSRILTRAEEILQKKVRSVVATYPTTFTTTQFRAIEGVFNSLGYSGSSLIMAWDEANGATLAYLYETIKSQSIYAVKALLPSPSYIMTFDFGGGTLDVACIKVEIESDDSGGDHHEVRTEIVGITGQKHLGGDNVTLAIFHVLKARLALYIAESGSEPGNVDDPERYRGAVMAVRDEAEAIRKALEAGKDLDERQARFVNDVLPTRYGQLSAADDTARRHFFELWDAADAMKKKFGTRNEDGSYPEEVKLESPLQRISEYTGIDFSQVTDVAVKRADYESRIAPPIREILERAKRLLPDGASYSLAILAGNSSNLPIVHSLSREVLDLTAQRIHFDPVEAKIAVAKGACFARRNELVPSVVRYRLGSLLRKLPWEIGCRVEGAPFEPFFVRGTELPTKTPYVFKSKNDVKLLPISTRLSAQDEPEAIGFFDFSSPDGDKDAPAQPGDVKKAIVQLQTQLRAQVKPGPAGKSREQAAPIFVWVDEDRRIGAEKNGKLYSFRPKPETFPPEADPFSGTH